MAKVAQHHIPMMITYDDHPGATQAIAVFISQPKIGAHLTKLELLAALTAAVTSTSC